MGRTNYPIAPGMIDGADCSTARTVIAARGTGILAIKSLMLSAAAASAVFLQDEDGNVIYPTVYLGANETFEINDLDGDSFKLPMNKALQVKADVSTGVSAAVEAYVE